MQGKGEKDLFSSMSNISTNFSSSSKLREIPDNEEVYVDCNGPGSIIIDISERVDGDGIHTDEEAFAYHIEDSIDPKNRLCVGSFERVEVSSLPNVPAYTTTAMTTPVEAEEDIGKIAGGTVKFVAIWLLLVRLKDQGTDILITVNVPYETVEGVKEEAKMAMKIADATERIAKALKKLPNGGDSRCKAAEEIAQAGQVIQANGLEIVKLSETAMLGPFAELSAEEMEDGNEIKEAILSSFQIRDWGMFVN